MPVPLRLMGHKRGVIAQARVKNSEFEPEQWKEDSNLASPVQNHLYFAEVGSTSAPTIVFIHAVGVNGGMWKTQIDTLQAEYHCLAVDLPGHGKSNAIPWVSLADSADQIAAMLHAHADRAYVVGLSLGSYVGVMLLSRHPDLVRRAVFSGITAGPLPNAWMYKLLAPILALGMKTDYFIKMNAKSLNIPDSQIAAYLEAARMVSRQAFIKSSIDAAQFSLPSNLNAINAPTLIVAGEHEHLLVKSGVRLIASQLPNGTGAIVPDVGHGWSAERPDLFMAMLRAWFTDQVLPNALNVLR